MAKEGGREEVWSAQGGARIPGGIMVALRSTHSARTRWVHQTSGWQETKMESYCARFIGTEPILKCEWEKKRDVNAL